MSPVNGTMANQTIGYWQITGYNRFGEARDLSTFRGLPTQLNSFSTADPFGAQQAQMTFPQITSFDAPGQGDLDWLGKGCLMTLRWRGKLPANYRYGVPTFTKARFPGQSTLTGWDHSFVWEGQFITPTFDDDAGMTIVATGAAYQQDFYQAKPEYPARPLPYEHAIARQFRNKPHLRLKPLKISWPADWGTIYEHPAKGTPSYMIPVNVRPGQGWTGLVTRETGRWEPTLTSYIQTLLSSMYTTNGRWTLDVWRNRRPVLEHRSILLQPDASTVVIDPVSPGVKKNLTVDWSQSLDVVFAQGTSLDGVAFSGMEVTSSGNQTYYLPAAARREAYPTEHNAWLDTGCMPIEIMLQLQTGLDEAHGQIVARDHLRRFADPGVTGTITLSDDPTIGGVQLPRFLVRAGMNVHLPGLFGKPEGMVLHVSQSQVSLDDGTNTLTVDSKFRDSVTVNEARLAGRDVLQVSRMLIAGQYQPPVDDQVIPWSYQKGSGYIPSWKGKSSLALFDGMPDNTQFPWSEWTQARPPSHHKWKHSYIGPITPDGSSASNMWAYRGSGQTKGRFGIGVRAAQHATIRLLQVAAYNADGTVAKVPFHISFYWNSGVAVNSMPMITSADTVVGGANATYPVKANYPFGSTAWEQYNPDGTLVNPIVPQAIQSSGLIRAYGTYDQMAGFYPGSDPGPTDQTHPNLTARLAKATGLLVDEATWVIDTTQTNQQWDPYSKKKDSLNPFAGIIYAMIYCDQVDGGAGEVYFLGRLFNAPPGSN